ncbi:MAG: L-serine ammonia-lyase, partial [Gemmatimonadota bacterium]|nr:L-serine ammonia-lyase [Gemmatimonadota bacterium]
MQISVLDLFKIGIGPSSSHTVGPMRAARRFAQQLADAGVLDLVTRVQTDLYGSLALTGRGHATDRAVILGLLGERPDAVDPDTIGSLIDGVRTAEQLRLAGRHPVQWLEPRDLIFHQREFLPTHPNGMRFTALDERDAIVATTEFYSVGGGFVVSRAEAEAGETGASPPPEPVRYPFSTAADLLAIGRQHRLGIPDIVRANEAAWRPAPETDAALDRIWQAMETCIDRGCRGSGELPGGLHVRRRAAKLFQTLGGEPTADPLTTLDWVSLFALAINEENAAGGRVVTAPTNGAAGVIPAVLAYYVRFLPGATSEGIRSFLLTAGAIGTLYKKNASLSAAEMGCQGEVGVACSMAAAGLAAVMGGTNEQIEEAAEIGMEHNLGLTCDPVAGLVQVPCIERNTMGATKAVNAARLAVLYGDGKH